MQAGDLTLRRQAYALIAGCQCITGAQGPQGPPGTPSPTGNFLRVDAVYGNDTTAAASPYTLPFLTITAALAAATSGQTVFIYPGAYNEAITIPTGVSIRGASTQTTSIQLLNVTTNTTLVTLQQNTRIEDLTLTLTSAADGIILIGVDFVSGASINAKMRTMVVNVSHTGLGSTTVYGVQSSGTSTLIPNSSNAIRALTINCASAGTGTVRGIIISGANQFTTRDTNVYATGTDSIGCVTTHVSAILTLRTSTISGALYDINRIAGMITLGLSDLANNNANSNSFFVSVEPRTLGFGIIGNPVGNTTYYLVPGIVSIGSLPASYFPIRFQQNTICISIYMKFTGTLGAGVTVTMTIYKNNAATSLTLTLNSLSGNSASLTISSVLFLPTDDFDVRFITVGNPGPGTFYGSVGVY